MSALSLSTVDEELVSADTTSSGSAAMDNEGQSSNSQTSTNDEGHDEGIPRTIIRVDDSATIDALVSTAVAALEINQRPENLLKRLPKEIREKIYEYHFINCTGVTYHPKREIKPLLQAFEITPTLYQEVIEYYFDQYYMTVTLNGWCPFLQNVRPGTIALLKNLAIFSDNEFWGRPPLYKQKKLYCSFQDEHPPRVFYDIDPQLQLHHALSLRNIFLSVTPQEPFLFPFLTALLVPGPTPLRALQIHVLTEDETPPDEHGPEPNKLSWEIFRFVGEKLGDMYEEECGFQWVRKRDWSGEGRRWPKVFCSERWRLYEGEEKMGNGPVIGDTVLVDLFD